MRQVSTLGAEGAERQVAASEMAGTNVLKRKDVGEEEAAKVTRAITQVETESLVSGGEARLGKG